MIKQYYLLILLFIPFIIFMVQNRVYLLCILIGLYYIFPKGMPFGVNIFSDRFSLGVADVALIGIGLYLLFTSKILTRKINRKSIEYSMLVIYFVQILSFIIDIAYGESFPFVVGNLVKYIEPIIFYEIIKKYYAGSGAELRHAIVIVCFIVNIIGLIQIVNPELYYKFISSSINSEETVDYISTFMYGRIASTMLNPGTYAWFLITTIPLELYSITEVNSFFRKFFYFIVILSSIAMLILTQSRTQWVALGIMAMFYIGKTIMAGNKKHIATIIIYLLILAYIINSFYGDRIIKRLIGINVNGDYNYFGITIGFSLAARINYFRAALDAIKDNAIIGVGYCNISNVLGIYVSKMNISDIFKISNPTIHNQYLSIILQTGVPISCIIFYSYYRIIKYINIESKQNDFGMYLLMIFIGIIISSFMGDILYSSRISSMLAILIATFEADNLSIRRKD
jgi:hypothetical protein